MGIKGLLRNYADPSGELIEKISWKLIGGMRSISFVRGWMDGSKLALYVIS